MRRLLIFCAAAVVFGVFVPAYASIITVPSGATLTTNGLSEATATIKDGVGTLELSGANTLKRMQVKAGVLHVSGGTTTISDSSATGTGTGAQVFEQIAGNTVIDGGATVTLSAGQYAITESGTLTITNATLDANGLTGHFMNAFRTSTGSDIATDGCKMIIDNGGVLRVASLRSTGYGTQGRPSRWGVVGRVRKTRG